MRSAPSFGHQVGGHPSTIQLSPLGSSTLIKPCAKRELAFYHQLGPKLDALVQGQGAFIGEWTPAVYGTLSLQGKMGEDGALDKGAGDEADPASEVGCTAYTHPRGSASHGFDGSSARPA